MTLEDRRTIRHFALGAKHLREEVIRIHRAEMAQNPAARKLWEVKFMGEVDSPSPDLALRAQYRKMVVDQEI